MSRRSAKDIPVIGSQRVYIMSSTKGSGNEKQKGKDFLRCMNVETKKFEVCSDEVRNHPDYSKYYDVRNPVIRGTDPSDSETGSSSSSSSSSVKSPSRVKSSKNFSPARELNGVGIRFMPRSGWRYIDDRNCLLKKEFITQDMRDDLDSLDVPEEYNLEGHKLPKTVLKRRQLNKEPMVNYPERDLRPASSRDNRPVQSSATQRANQIVSEEEKRVKSSRAVEALRSSQSPRAVQQSNEVRSYQAPSMSGSFRRF